MLCRLVDGDVCALLPAPTEVAALVGTDIEIGRHRDVESLQISETAKSSSVAGFGATRVARIADGLLSLITLFTEFRDNKSYCPTLFTLRKERANSLSPICAGRFTKPG